MKEADKFSGSEFTEDNLAKIGLHIHTESWGKQNIRLPYNNWFSLIPAPNDGCQVRVSDEYNIGIVFYNKEQIREFLDFLKKYTKR